MSSTCGRLFFGNRESTSGERKGRPVAFVSPKSEASIREIDLSPTLKADIYGHLLETRKPDAAAKTNALIFGVKQVHQN